MRTNRNNTGDHTAYVEVLFPISCSLWNNPHNNTDWAVTCTYTVDTKEIYESKFKSVE